MGVMQLDPIETRFASPAGSPREETGKCPRQSLDVGKVEIGDSLPVAKAQIFELSVVEYIFQLIVRHGCEGFSHLLVGSTADEISVALGELQIAVQEFLWLRSSAYRQEVDDLNEETGATLAGSVNSLYELAQAGQEAVMTDTEQRAAGHIADPCRFHDQGSGRTTGEAFVPTQDFLSDVALLGSPPRHHGWNPGALSEV